MKNRTGNPTCRVGAGRRFGCGTLAGYAETLESEQEKVVIAGNTVDYTGSDENSMPVSQHLIRTPCGGEYSLTLADGTKVWLNAMSELKYPTRFNGNTRCVELKGEAFFEVKPDAQRPFYVKIDTMR